MQLRRVIANVLLLSVVVGLMGCPVAPGPTPPPPPGPPSPPSPPPVPPPPVPPPPPPGVSVSLNPPLAAQSETVTATLTGLSAPGAHVTVAGLKASVQNAVANTVVFRVPTNASGGPQTVLIRTNDGTARASLGVLGKVSRNEVLVLVRAGVNQDVFEQRIESLGLGLTLMDFRALSGNGPCGGAIARVGVPMGSALGAVLARLAQPDNQDLILQSDPQSLWGLDASSSPLTAMGVPTARSVRNRTGAGVTIAVLDTGVLSSHSQINGRVLPGYDFVDRDANPGDTFDDPTTGQSMDGHGTPAAVLAAGTAFGVANQASILPVRVGDVNGEVRSDRVLEGLCYALKTVNPQKLVLNLSFGGDTPVEAHRVILEYAIGQGAVVVAAAGNQGAGGPTHYPAAHDLNGLIAVGALKFDLPSMNWIPADFSTHGAYVDIVAPGEGLTSGNALGSFQQYTGTSFSAPLVAGAVALWRQANPAWTPAQIEQGIKDNALVLPFPAPSVGAGMVSVAVQP